MAIMYNYLAIDLGAESGRTIIGSLEDNRLSLAETYRFANEPVRLPDGLHWDVLHLWSGIKSGIAISSRRISTKLDSMGLDSWGVDFAFLDKRGELLSNPFHYRDERTESILSEAFNRMPASKIFACTGVQFIQINTLFQLLAMSIQKTTIFDAADRFVTIPDLFNYWLSGEITNEFTVATTTQCFDPHKRDWAIPVLQAMEIPTDLFGPVIEPGTVIGTLLPQVANETGASEVQIVAPACHDTASAVVAVPAQNSDFAWISSGTWSIMGAEVYQPFINEKALEYNFTNEGGVFGTWRFSKNIMGLWLVQECRREWCRQGVELSYDEMTNSASESQPFLSVIDPDFEGFLYPGDMASRIQKYCVDTKQAVPHTKGQILRIAFEGIALKYRLILEKLEEIIGKQLNPIHIVGGGARNRLLNQFTADATGRVVVAGPVEATAIGNILMQAITFNHIGSLAEARTIVRTSFSPEVYEPQKTAVWDDAYSRLRKVMK